MEEEYKFLKGQINQFLYDFPHYITDPDFEIKLFNYIKIISMDFIHEEDLNYLYQHEVPKILKELHLERTTHFDEKPSEVSKEYIEYLKNIKQPQQRTTQWYNFRNNHITASNAWKAYSTSEATKNQLIYEKIKPYVQHNSSSLSENAFTWGHKYEPLTSKIYEMRNKTTISEFGCIEHPKYKFLAASPDGIVTGDNYFGRMIEIKNVVSRVINGNPKKEYYIQMQLQMEVCDLNECDFVETKFIEYENLHDYMNDGHINYSDEHKEKGIIKVYVKNNEEYIYDYMPFEIMDISSMELWLDEPKEDLQWIKNVYWKLDVYSCVQVPRCKLWFERTLGDLENIWNIILKERENNNHEAYKPKKRKKEEIIHKEVKCLINL
jgi:putative phage-type endonuclease